MHGSKNENLFISKFYVTSFCGPGTKQRDRVTVEVPRPHTVRHRHTR